MLASNVRDVVQAYPRLWNKSALPEHIQEQVKYRAALCYDCTKLTHCKICKCSTPAIYFAPHRVDKADKWGPFLEVQE